MSKVSKLQVRFSMDGEAEGWDIHLEETGPLNARKAWLGVLSSKSMILRLPFSNLAKALKNLYTL